MALKDDLKVEVANIAKEISAPFAVVLLKYLEMCQGKAVIKIPKNVLIAFVGEIREFLNELEAQKISYELIVD